MSRNPSPGAILAAAVIVLLPVGAQTARALAEESPPPVAGTTPTLVATLCLVDTETRTIELITGRGHALRVVRMQVGPGCRIQVAGSPAELRDLKSGAIVRVEHGRSGEPRAATAIDTVRLQVTEGKP